MSGVWHKGKSVAEHVAVWRRTLPDADRRWLEEALCPELQTEWKFWARPAQVAPKWPWAQWLILGGRGFGKTRAGAEWVRGWAERDPTARIALVGGTAADVRDVMIGGESGLIAISPKDRRPAWEVSKRRLVWPNGAQAFAYSAEEPDQLRGPQHHAAWCDELAKWSRAQETWDNLKLGLRLGERPRAVVTTTPRPLPLLKALIADRTTALTRGATRENLHLPENFRAMIEERYGQTRLGRQELEGELIEDAEGSLWTRPLLERCRARAAPGLRRVVVGVDPPAGGGKTEDACGIVVCGLANDGRGYVLADRSVAGASPEGWARACASAASEFDADRLIAEVNNGGAMVESVLRSIDRAMPLKLVRAAHGKVARAEPVAALYEAGKIGHVGAFPALEDELCGLISGGAYVGPGRSPDRADALVWAMTELMLGKPLGEPGMRVV